MLRRNVQVLTLGGTIAFVVKDGKAKIADIAEFVAGMDELKDIANVKAKSFRKKSSSSMDIQDLLDIAREIRRLGREEGTEGFVIVQGTDTIEETAFAMNLLVDTEAPIVVTGAMRNPNQRGAEGPANLLASIVVASSEAARGMGSLVVFNDRIFPGDYVQKIHPQNVDAFGAECGPIGYVAEGRVSMRTRPIRRKVQGIEPREGMEVSVPIYSVPIGDDGRMLSKSEELALSGIVLEGMGGGHTSPPVAALLKDLAPKLPIVLSSCIGCGDMLTQTYMGYPGAELELLKLGLISSGLLDGRKARILLLFLLMSGASVEKIREAFCVYSKFFEG